MKDNTVYLEHIIAAIASIEEYTEDLNEDSFLTNKMAQDAVIRKFEIIGEATKRISKEFRDEHTHILWNDMAGMRDVLIHDYIDVDLWTVWRTTKNEVPILKKQIQDLLK